jgi:hypothetical protein
MKAGFAENPKGGLTTPFLRGRLWCMCECDKHFADLETIIWKVLVIRHYLEVPVLRMA